MARFRFKLDPVLEQRRRAEKDKMRAVAELERDRTELEGVIRGARVAMDDERDRLREILAPGQPVHIGGAKLQAGASLGHMARAQRAVLKLAGVHRRLQEARTELAGAAAERRAVESLRERRHEAWKRGEAKKESAALDDMANARAVARVEEEGSPG